MIVRTEDDQSFVRRKKDDRIAVEPELVEHVGQKHALRRELIAELALPEAGRGLFEAALRVNALQIGERELLELLDAEAQLFRIFDVFDMPAIEREPDAEIQRERSVERPLRTSIELEEAARPNAWT